MEEKKETSEVNDSGEETLFEKLKEWAIAAREFSSAWRTEAQECFGFVAGDQWSEDDKQKLRDQLRPCITFNRTLPIVDTISGLEIGNRQEITYLPREQGDVKTNEILTSAADYLRDNTDAEDEETDAFRDAVICGMGWTESRLDYEQNPDGDYREERIDPIEMYWDGNAKRANLIDGRYLCRAKEWDIEDAKAKWPDFEEEDYHATWFNKEREEKEPSINDNKFYDGNAPGEKKDKRDTVLIVQVQWFEREPFYRVNHPQTGEIVELDVAGYRVAKLAAQEQGIDLKGVPQVKRVYKNAFLGAVLLEEKPALCKDHFNYQCVTGKRDRNRNYWFGVVKPMLDPQRWANKFLSQTLHIMNASAKGGIMAERGAFEDDKQAEESWAKTEQITYTKQGALSGPSPKIQPKPQTQMPSGFLNLMEFAISSVRDVSGVSLELLGQRGAEQAASLEYQRRQSAITILAGLFDSLRRCRKIKARNLLYLIQNYLSDERLVRVVGKDMEQYIPLTRDKTAGEFDVIVDESPTSPNQKEKTWQVLTQMLPVLKDIMPPKMWGTIAKFSPLPSSVSDDLVQGIEEAASQPPPPNPDEQKMQAELQIKGAEHQQRMAERQADFQFKLQELQLQAQSQQADRQAELSLKDKELELKQQEFLIKQVELNARLEEAKIKAKQPKKELANKG